MGKKESFYCDICEGHLDGYNDVTLQVIFTTDQTEGRSIKPYLSLEKMDVCLKCLDHVLKGNYLWAHGAQGHNTYYFKNKGETK